MVYNNVIYLIGIILVTSLNYYNFLRVGTISLFVVDSLIGIFYQSFWYGNNHETFSPKAVSGNNFWKGEKHLNHLEFGPVICTKGPYKGKIGYLDDEDICEGNQFGIVYFGNPSFCSSFHLVPITYLSNEITMYEIIQRKETLQQQILNEKDEKKKIYWF